MGFDKSMPLTSMQSMIAVNLPKSAHSRRIKELKTKTMIPPRSLQSATSSRKVTANMA